MVFGGRQKKVEEQIRRYCETVLKCVEAFQRAVHKHSRQPDPDDIGRSFQEVHKAESLADDIRRDVEVLMYSKALFPESRGDILGLLETMDRVPNHAEACVQRIYVEHIAVPEPYGEDIRKLADVCVRCVKAMVDSVQKVFSDYTGATVAVGKIDELETEADHIESALIERMFTSDMEGVQKLLLRDLVRHIAGICDRAENVGDRIRIIVAKRGI